MLGARDPLPQVPERALVAGPAGDETTGFSARLAAALDVPYVGLHTLRDGPDFSGDLRRLAEFDGWVTEWSDPAARPVLLDRAGLLVWLDLPITHVLGHVVRHTGLRRARRDVRTAFAGRKEYDDLVPAAAASYPDLVVVRLTREGDFDGWLAGLGP